MPLPIVAIAVTALTTGVVTSITSELVKGPLQNILGGVFPHESARVQMLMKAYASGAISRSHFLATTAIRDLEPETKEAVVAYADFSYNTVQQVRYATEVNYLNKLQSEAIDELEKIIDKEYDARLDALEADLKELEKEALTVAKEELKMEEEEALRLREAILKQLEARLVKAVAGEEITLPSIEVVSYEDFRSVAENTLLTVINDRVLAGLSLGVGPILDQVEATILSQQSLTPEVFEFAKDSGYFDRFKGEAYEIVLSILSQPDEVFDDGNGTGSDGEDQSGSA